MGTTRVKGNENEESMDVTVDIYTDVQAPPEQMLKGMDRAEKTLSNTSLTTELAALCLRSIIE